MLYILANNPNYNFRDLSIEKDDILYFLNTAIGFKLYRKFKNEMFLFVRNKTNGYWNNKNTYKNKYKCVTFLPSYNSTSDKKQNDIYFKKFSDEKQMICRDTILRYIPTEYLKQFKKKEPSTGFMLYWFLRHDHTKDDIKLVGFTGTNEDNINKKNWYGHNFDLEQFIYEEINQKII